MAKTDIILFWKPYNEYGYFSQWYASDMVIDKITFKNAEQYMMYKKATLFHNYELAQEILDTDDPATIKKLGRKVIGFEQDKWDAIKETVIYRGNFEKFTQNKKLTKLLLKTRNATLAEATPFDLIYGIGYSKTHPHATNPTKWKGQNLLGKTLMEVRKSIRILLLK